jgi:16S rRNA (adenine1518-N6/adenine1519-N6)-dimethyltransferase
VQRLSEIKALLAERGLSPRKRFGQNFLHDHNLLRRLVDASNVGPGDLVLEVGPGTGTLTEAILERGGDVIAVEIDDGLADLMASRFGDRITLVRGDCLGRGRSLSGSVVEAIGGRPFRLLANLPYQIASPLMVELLFEDHGCIGQCVTIQNEVADRLLAAPGSSAWGPLSILVQCSSDVERIATLGPGCFWPPPKVTSAMVRITPQRRPALDLRSFATFITKLFSTRRKQLGGVVGIACVRAAGIEPTQRCERLDIDSLERLYRAVRDTEAC